MNTRNENNQLHFPFSISPLLSYFSAGGVRVNVFFLHFTSDHISICGGSVYPQRQRYNLSWDTDEKRACLTWTHLVPPWFLTFMLTEDHFSRHIVLLPLHSHFNQLNQLVGSALNTDHTNSNKFTSICQGSSVLSSFLGWETFSWKEMVKLRVWKGWN